MLICFQHFLNAVFGGLLSWPMLQPEFVDPASHMSPVSSVPVVASILSIKAFVFLLKQCSIKGLADRTNQSGCSDRASNRSGNSCFVQIQNSSWNQSRQWLVSMSQEKIYSRLCMSRNCKDSLNGLFHVTNQKTGFQSWNDHQDHLYEDSLLWNILNQQELERLPIFLFQHLNLCPDKFDLYSGFHGLAIGRLNAEKFQNFNFKPNLSFLNQEIHPSYHFCDLP